MLHRKHKRRMVWPLLVTVVCALHGLLIQCAPESVASYKMPVGTTVSLAPASELSLKQAEDSANSAKSVSLSIRWNGGSLAAVPGGVQLRFYREGEKEPMFETTWQELVRTSKAAGCPLPEATVEDGIVVLCDGRLGNLGVLSKVDGVSGVAGEIKTDTNPAKAYVGSDTVHLLVQLY